MGKAGYCTSDNIAHILKSFYIEHENTNNNTVSAVSLYYTTFPLYSKGGKLCKCDALRFESCPQCEGTMSNLKQK